MSLYRTIPLTDRGIFTTPADERKRAPWGATWQRTLQDLERELDYLDADDVVLELDILANKIRRDGLPMADARIGHPGCRLAFTSPHGAMSFSCDTYLPDWKANLRAIVLTLTALRAVDRYGATQGEQYSGFAALPPGAGATALGGMTRSDARGLLIDVVSKYHDTGTLDDRTLYRRARRYSHPDYVGGDQSLWDQVEQAGRVLGLAR